jgi:hypothetical protein
VCPSGSCCLRRGSSKSRSPVSRKPTQETSLRLSGSKRVPAISIVGQFPLVLPDRALHLLTFSHLMIVNKLLSLSLLPPPSYNSILPIKRPLSQLSLSLLPPPSYNSILPIKRPLSQPPASPWEKSLLCCRRHCPAAASRHRLLAERPFTCTWGKGCRRMGAGLVATGNLFPHILCRPQAYTPCC